MKNTLLILSIIILAGCSPTKRLARLLERYPMEPTVDTVYKDTTIYRDTIVTKYLPGEVVTRSYYIDVPVSIPDTFIEMETSLAYSLAWLQDNELGLQLTQKDTVLKWLLDSAIVHNIDTIIVTRDVPYPVVEKMKGVKPFYKHGFFVLAGLALIFLLLFFVFRRK